MKFFKYIAIVAAACSLMSCHEDDKMKARPAGDITPPVLNAHSDIVVDEATLDNEVTFSWSAVDYGYPAAISYGLYAVYGDSEPYQIGESYSTSYTLTKEALNNVVVQPKGLGVPENATSTLFFYVASSISEKNTDYTFQSAAISLDITTITSTAAGWIRRPLYVAGNFQGWAPEKAPVLWETEENSDVYEGLIYLGNAAGTPNADPDGLCHFKFCPNPSWTGNLGGDPNALTAEGDPAHITAADGLYWVTVKLNAEHTTGTVTLKTVTQIGVIGEAIGSWDNDLVLSLAGLPTDTSAPDYADLYYAAMNGQTWEGVCPTTVAGEFKFRLDGAWAQNWGGDNLEHLQYNGGNIKTTLSGNVRFTINFRGNIPELAEDATNPSPISATVTQVE